MKKLTSICLAACITLGLSGCGGGISPTESGSPAIAPGNNTPSPASEIQVTEYLSGDYTSLPEDGPTVNLSLGHAMQESTESHKMLVALKMRWKSTVMEKSSSRFTQMARWGATQR